MRSRRFRSGPPRALEIGEQEHIYERNYNFVGPADCGICDPAALPDPQAETTGNRVRIAEDVPVLRVDYVSIKSTLPGVW